MKGGIGGRKSAFRAAYRAAQYPAHARAKSAAAWRQTGKGGWANGRQHRKYLRLWRHLAWQAKI